LRTQIEELRPFRVHQRFSQVGSDKLIGSAQWVAPDGFADECYYVLTYRDGKIVDMQECPTRRQAVRFARR
jgi:hypothetical protein